MNWGFLFGYKNVGNFTITTFMDKDYEIRVIFEKNKYCYTTHSNLTLLIGEAKSYIVVNSNLLRGFFVLTAIIESLSIKNKK